jgi:hypothetical protein
MRARKKDSIFSARVFLGVPEEGDVERAFLERVALDTGDMHAGESGMDQDALLLLSGHCKQCTLSLD